MPLPIANATLPRTGKLSYLYPRTATHRHRGIDLPAPAGTPVRATAPGKVVHAVREWRQGFTGYGRVVVLEHGDGLVYTLHAHLQDVRVNVGDYVNAGDVIGTVGNTQFTKEGGYTDSSGDPHLHFEVSATPYPQDSEAPRLDPVRWLEGVDAGGELHAGASITTGARGAALFAFALGALVFVLKKQR